MKKILVKGNRIKFGPVELRRVKVLDPKAQPKTVTVLIPKKEEGLITTIYQLSEEARIKSGLSSDMWIGPLNDGDVEEHRWQDDFAGYYYFAPTAFDKTHFVFDAEGKPITDKDGLRDGDFAYLTLEMLTSKKENNKKGKAVAYSRIIRIDKAEMEETQREIAPIVIRKVDSQVELITPEMAKYYLSFNKNNRSISPNIVNYYARQMREELWEENDGEPITFSKSGTLLDGQHRLTAIIASGKAVRMTVVRGAKNTDSLVLNQGKARTKADILTIAGLTATKAQTITAIFNKYYSFKGKLSIGIRPNAAGPIKTKLPSAAEYLAEYQSRQEYYDEVVLPIASKYGKRGDLLVEGFVGGMYLAICNLTKYSGDIAEAFFKELVFGETNNPTLTSLRKIITQAKNKNKGKFNGTDPELISLIIKGFNYFARGKKVKKLTLKKEERAEKVFFENLRTAD